MNDKFILYDMLNTEKNMKINTATALNEASCDEIYNLYHEIFEDISSSAKNLFTIGFNNNWYTLEETTQTKIKESHTKLNNSLKEE